MQNLYEHSAVKKFVQEVANPSIGNTQIPVNSRVVVNGGTSSGKTHMLTHFIMNSPKTFQHIIIINQGIEEPLYEMLKSKLAKGGKITFFEPDNFPTAKEICASREDEKDEYLIVFDDMMADIVGPKMIKKVKQFFIFGRKLHMTLFFLTQDFHSLPKPFRGQMSHLICLRLANDDDLNLILRKYKSVGVSQQQLVEMYRTATEEPFNFLKIAVLETDENKKFTRNFTDEFHIRKGIDEKGEMKSQIFAGPWCHTRNHFAANTDKDKKRSRSKQVESESEADDSEDEDSHRRKK
jgi:hypothetical protein